MGLNTNKERNTYKYRLKRDGKIVHYGITYDLVRRETEHQKDFPGAVMEQVGERTTHEKALKWLRGKTKKQKPKEAFITSVATLTLEEFKLACISDEELTDEQVDILMRMVVLGSEEEVVEFCAILHKYRPALEKKFAAELKKKKAE